jgi:NAD(P)-dependent dehydrogenase (short-subunit alcohol dehydrogenase family)
VASIAAALRGIPGFGPYSGANAGVIALIRTAAVEYVSQGIRRNVSAVAVDRNAVLRGGDEARMLGESFGASAEFEAAMSPRCRPAA